MPNICDYLFQVLPTSGHPAYLPFLKPVLETRAFSRKFYSNLSSEGKETSCEPGTRHVPPCPSLEWELMRPTALDWALH